MSRRLLVLRNVLKAWLVVLAFGLLFGFAGWKLGGFRLGVLFGASIALLAAALYYYAERIVMGMVGARELLPGEAPALHSTIERLGSRAGVVKPRLYVLGDSYPRALSAGRGAGGGTGLAVSGGPGGGAGPGACGGWRPRSAWWASRRGGSGRGSWPTSSRTCGTATCSCRRSLSSSRPPSSRPRASAARCSGGSSSCSARLRPPSRTSCSRRSASSSLTASPPSSATRRTASQTCCCASSRRCCSSASRRARRPSLSTRRTR